MTLTKPDIEQRHFFEERFLDKHQECYYSHAGGVTIGVCKCSEYFFIHEDHAFAGEKELKKLWRSHAKGK